MSRTLRSVALVLLLVTLPATGQAAIITFDTFTGLNPNSGVPSYLEDGFAVTSLGSDSLSNIWAAELGAGNPARSMDWDFSNTGPVQNTLAVTRNGGLDQFVFNSVDFQAYNLEGATMRYLIEGLLAGGSPLPEFAISGPFTGVAFGDPLWTTVSGDGSTLIDTLSITVFFEPAAGLLNISGPSTRGVGLLLDNINLSNDPTTPVPVPATLALFGLGLAGLGWSRRKKA